MRAWRVHVPRRTQGRLRGRRSARVLPEVEGGSPSHPDGGLDGQAWAAPLAVAGVLALRAVLGLVKPKIKTEVRASWVSGGPLYRDGKPVQWPATRPPPGVAERRATKAQRHAFDPEDD